MDTEAETSPRIGCSGGRDGGSGAAAKTTTAVDACRLPRMTVMPSLRSAAFISSAESAESADAVAAAIAESEMEIVAVTRTLAACNTRETFAVGHPTLLATKARKLS